MVILPHRRKAFRTAPPDNISTSYSNPGGSGNRTSGIPTITQSGASNPMNAPVNFFQLKDGNKATSNIWMPNGCADGEWLKFDFSTAKVINEIKFYQSGAQTQGVWQWEGSNDNSTWTSIGSTFTLGGATTSTITALSANTTAFRYYRMKKISGSTNQSPYALEFEFKISL
jgi:hypothetical protein